MENFNTNQGMKKFIFLLSVLAIAGLCSCDKTYKCTCTAASLPTGYGIDTDVINSANKLAAKNSCSAFQVVQQQKLEIAGDTTTVNCSI